jgi:opacity protein-like surface antigen
MKRLLVGTLLALGSAAAGLAQAPSPANNEVQNTAPIDFATTSGANVTLLEPVHFSGAILAKNESGDGALLKDWSGSVTGALAAPEPAPEPKFVFGGRDDFRWQLGIGFAWTRFRSSIFNASAVGVNTSLSYFTNDWFAIEGNVNSTFAPEIFDNDRVKFVVYGAGPKIAWRQRRWEPWLHGLVGGIHEQPKTAGNSKNGFAAQMGGGADFRWLPRLAVRLEADYMRSSLFSDHQNNFQLCAGLVFHF